LNPDQRRERIQYLWNIARRYANKLRIMTKLGKMAENKLREMMIDDINEEADDEVRTENGPKLKWYMIQADGTFCKIWN